MSGGSASAAGQQGLWQVLAGVSTDQTLAAGGPSLWLGGERFEHKGSLVLPGEVSKHAQCAAETHDACASHTA